MPRMIGIDLGTATAVACFLQDGRPVVVPGASSGATTPSAVAFAQDGPALVGAAAVAERIVRPARAVEPVLGRLGTDWTIGMDGEVFTAQEIVALVLRKLRLQAEAHLGEAVTSAVVAVPSYFSDAARQAVKEAGEIAGLPVARLINEFTAVALAYAVDMREGKETILILDLGASTCTASVVEVGRDADGSRFVEARATSCESDLGGDDWDRAIVKFLTDGFRDEHGIDLSRDMAAMARLREAAEQAKIELSSRTEVVIDLPFLATSPQGPLNMRVILTRPQFQRLTAELLERCRAPFVKAIADAGLSVRDLDHVMLVGGSSRMPAVAQLVRELTGGKPPRARLEADLAVALGAAVETGVLSKTLNDVMVLDLIPMSLGIETKGGVMTRLIERNSVIPTRQSEIFTTAEDNQPSVQIQVYQGEREIAAYNKRVGMFELTGLPPSPRGVPQIEVTFGIDFDGIVTVSARDLGRERDHPVTMTGRTALSTKQIGQMADRLNRLLTGSATRRPVDGRDVAVELTLDAEELRRGTTAKVAAPVRQDCSSCGGSGRDQKDVPGRCLFCHGTGSATGRTPLSVRIPAGAKAGARLRVPGRGDPGQHGGKPGDLYLTLSVRPTATDGSETAAAPLAPGREAKVVVLGEGTVGKTTLIAALRGDPFADHSQTHGIEVRPLRAPDPVSATQAEMTLWFWDFGGQAVYRITHQFFYTPDALYLVVWNARSGQEKDDLAGWLSRLHFRLGDRARVLLVATHCDETYPDLDFRALQTAHPGMLLGLHRVDNKSGNGIAQLRAEIVRHCATTATGEPEDAAQTTVRARILTLAQAQPQISYRAFLELCAAEALDEQAAERLAKLLNDQGRIVHHTDEGLRDLVILNPEWLSKAIALVLADQVTAEARGVLDHRRLPEIWQVRPDGPRYDPEQFPYFLRLMEKFDVSYRLEGGRHSLIAQLVPHERPRLPWEHASPLEPGTRRLVLTTELPQSVPGLVAALTVRMHEASSGRHWRRGMFLRHPNPVYASEALIELDRRGRTLSMEVRAPSPDLFFHVIRDSVEHLLSRRWPGMRYQQFVPCPAPARADRADAGCGGRFRLDRLLEARTRGTVSVMCQECFEHSDIAEMLTGFPPAARAGHEAGYDGVREDWLREQISDLRDGVDQVGRSVRDLHVEAATSAHLLRQVLTSVST